MTTRLFPMIVGAAVLALALLPTAGVAQKSAKPTGAIPGEANVKRSTQIYKTIGDVELKMFIYKPADWKATDKRPAIVFFFGGGWRSGSTSQFEKQATYLASRGMVAMAADYRVKSRQGVDPEQCVNDAKSAIRWVRSHAGKLGVDPNKIVSSGGSAGGHLAAAVGTVKGFEEKGEDTAISSVPNAMVCFNPALDTTKEAWGDLERGKGLEERFGGAAKSRALSPLHSVKKGTPPTLILHGEDDPTVPFSQATAFAKAMKAAGNRCEVAGYKGERHGFFNFGKGGNKMFIATLVRTDEFLQSLGYLKGEATLKN